MTRADQPAAVRSYRRIAPLLASGLMVLMLGGCESGSSPFGGSTPAATTAVAPTPTVTRKKLAVAPVIGAPSAVSKRLETTLAASVRGKSVPVAQRAGEQADYTVRGYVVAAPAKAGTKLSYIWDVTDAAGKRAHRITGEEIVPGPKSKDPWANVSDQVVKSIADKTAVQLAAWVPSNGVAGATPAATGAVTPSLALAKPAAGVSQPKPVALASKTRKVARVAKLARTRTPKVSAKPKQKLKPKLASVQRSGGAQAMVPLVAGAPGDGSTSLASALQLQLIKSGVAIVRKPSKATYTIRGKVAVAKPKSGKQNIRIQWQVLDPKGKRVGTVSQKNTIPQGSLDGKWGRTADAAAAAAAQGILKLLPKRRMVN